MLTFTVRFTILSRQYPHIYFESYVIVIMKVNNAERKEPRVKKRLVILVSWHCGATYQHENEFDQKIGSRETKLVNLKVETKLTLGAKFKDQITYFVFFQNIIIHIILIPMITHTTLLLWVLHAHILKPINTHETLLILHALVESEALVRAFSPGSTLEPELKAFYRRGPKWLL
jgi:hypothetical protein